MHFHRAKQAYHPLGFQCYEDTEHGLMADQQYKNTDPQKKSGGKGSPEVSSPIPRSQQGNSKARPGCSGPCSHNLRTSPRAEIPQPFWAPVPLLNCSQVGEIFLYISSELPLLQLVPVVSCPFTMPPSQSLAPFFSTTFL